MDAAARKEKMKRDNENASAIAEKLLQGWTMLAEYCPVEGCVTPLMRSRDQKVFCVAHDMFVMSSEQADKMKHSGAGVGGEGVPLSRPAKGIYLSRRRSAAASASGGRGPASGCRARLLILSERV